MVIIWFLVLLAVVAVWEMIWKGIALWRCGRNNHLVWFILILLLNTVGILPLVYLIWFDKEKKVISNKPVKRR